MSGKGHQQGFYMKDILFFRKRSGRVVKFNQGKIASAIARALKETQAAIQADVPSNTPELLAQKVCEELNNPESKFYVQEDTIGSRIPKLEDVQDAVETVIGKVHTDIEGYTEQVATTINRLYSGYRKAREEIRNKVKVISKRKKEKVDSTDKGMLLQETDNNVMTGWDRNRLENDLNDLLKDEDKSADIAKRVEKAVLSSGLQEITSDLIAEFANNELTKDGLQVRLNQGNGYLVEKDFIDALVASKTKENSNVVNNNPEAINMAVAEYVLKKWGFDSVFSSDVVEAHQYGFIYIHDLGSIMKVYALSGMTPVIAKYKGEIHTTTLKALWETFDVPEKQLNDTQFEKSLIGKDVFVRKGDSWVAVERLVLSKEKKKAVDFIFSGGHRLSVTEEHAVPVKRDDRLLLVRADEVLTTDEVIALR